VDPHRLAERRSLAYHQAVAAQITRDPALLTRARARVNEWLAEGRSTHYARAWREVLSGTANEVARVLVSDDEQSRAMRQATPFAGALDPRERWRIWREVADEGAVR
jgi:hypothetical protein